jgi:methylated-DNA-[protein]-cysteine S-methyltransferase
MQTKKYPFIPAPLWVGELNTSPLGPVSAAVSTRGLVRVEFCPKETLQAELSGRLGEAHSAPASLRAALDQIGEYLLGRRRTFDLPVDWRGMSAFDEKVLRFTYFIPFGKVHTYGEIAVLVGRPGAARAVGSAQSGNPMPLVIPCHRVVGSDRRLHGYSAAVGLEGKAWLLRLEGHEVSADLKILSPLDE